MEFGRVGMAGLIRSLENSLHIASTPILICARIMEMGSRGYPRRNTWDTLSSSYNRIRNNVASDGS